MPSADDLDAMDAMGNGYVVGARLRRLPVRLREQILGNDACGPLQGSRGCRVGEWQHQGRRLIVVRRPERARKDARDRRRMAERLLDRPSRSSNPEAADVPRSHSLRAWVAPALKEEAETGFTQLGPRRLARSDCSASRSPHAV